MQRFRGGLVFKAHRLCVSLSSRLERVIKRYGADRGFELARVVLVEAVHRSCSGAGRFGTQQGSQAQILALVGAIFRDAPVRVEYLAFSV